MKPVLLVLFVVFAGGLCGCRAAPKAPKPPQPLPAHVTCPDGGPWADRSRQQGEGGNVPR